MSGYSSGLQIFRELSFVLSPFEMESYLTFPSLRNVATSTLDLERIPMIQPIARTIHYTTPPNPNAA